MSLPSPGMENKVSVTTAAVMEEIASGPSTETTGSSAGRSAWRSTTMRIGRPLARAVRMKLELITSIRLPRITRPTVERLIRLSNAMGSTQKRSSWSLHPPEGNQGSQMANTITSTGPRTKDGTALPTLPTSISR